MTPTPPASPDLPTAPTRRPGRQPLAGAALTAPTTPYSPLIARLASWDIELAELLAALPHVFLGVQLLLPVPTFNLSPLAFRLFDALAPEWCWGLLSLGVGGLRLAALWGCDHGLTRNDQSLWRRCYCARAWASTLSTATWWLYTAFLGLGAPAAPSVAFGAAAAVGSSLLSLRLAASRASVEYFRERFAARRDEDALALQAAALTARAVAIGQVTAVVVTTDSVTDPQSTADQPPTTPQEPGASGRPGDS